MVLVTQSSINDDSQSRQFRVSKKLSKAISSVPRSRFQKPRPNLPGSKRSEPSGPSVRKVNETAENTVIRKTENSIVNELSQNSDILESATTVSRLDISSSNETVNTSENLSTKDISSSNETSNTSESLSTKDISSSNENVNASENISTNIFKDISSSNKTVNASENISTKEAAQNDDPCKVTVKLVTDKVSQNTDAVKLTDHTIIIEKSQSADELKKITLHIEEIPHSDATENSISTNESIQELSGEKAPTFEVPDSFDVLPINTSNNNDKSFKYPHLTSILSKKRAEPKKEVQHKKRKKFKKGDTAPERSKMTMADLIYWNPTNTEPPPSKSAVTEYEITTNSNLDDPEESPDIDTPIEESNICDSVPKLVISEDGSINIDQSSLVVSRNIAEPTVTEVIRKDDTTYSSFRKRPMTKHWTAKDTTIFYKALSLVGTDFGLMEKIFPHRTRRELKLKFKREEKFNIDLINRAMYESHLTFDANTLGDLIKNLNDLTGDFSSENGREDSQSSSKEKKKPVKRKRKISKVIEPLESVVSDSLIETTIIKVSSVTTNSDTVKTKRRRKTKQLPEDFVDIDGVDDIISSEEEENGETNTSVVETPCELNSFEDQQITSERNLHQTEGTEENLCKEKGTDKNILEKEDTGKNSHEKEGTELKSVPNSNNVCEETNIEILCIDDIEGVDFSSEDSTTILVEEKTFDNSELITTQDTDCKKPHETISVVANNKQEQCITLEYVDVNEPGDLTLLNNVMAFEVVASNTPIPKRRRKTNFTPKIPKRDTLKSCQPIKLSSTNYTPV